jgi:heat shock protein HslJ
MENAPERKHEFVPAALVTLAMAAAAPAGAADSPTLEALGELSYQGIYEQPVHLDRDVYQGAPFVEAGPDDAACCPTRKVRRVHGLDAAGAITVDSEDQGPVGIAEFEGVAWRLVELGRDDTVPEGVEVTATFEGGRVAGKAGCNRYFAAVESPEPGALKVRHAGLTMMMCPEPMMSVERRFLAALQEARRFAFRHGRLVLDHASADGTGSLVFVQDDDR